MSTQAKEVKYFLDKMKQTRQKLNKRTLEAVTFVNEAEVREAVTETIKKYNTTAERFGNIESGEVAVLYPTLNNKQRNAIKTRVFTVFLKKPGNNQWAEVTYHATIYPDGTVTWN